MRNIQINDMVEVKVLKRKGKVINIIGQSYELQIGKAFFVFQRRDLEPEKGMGTYLRSLI